MFSYLKAVKIPLQHDAFIATDCYTFQGSESHALQYVLLFTQIY